MNNKKFNIKKSYKKVVGASVACLSIFATFAIGGNVSHATNDLKPELVQAVAYVEPEAQVTATPSFVANVKEVALKQVGIPYVYGGTTRNGFDCSGFTQYVFKAAGVNLPRVARDQATIDGNSSFNTTTITNNKDIKEGDLIFFSATPGRVSHVGIALDNNKYIHASTSQKRITIANRSGSWYNGNFTKAIRINK